VRSPRRSAFPCNLARSATAGAPPVPPAPRAPLIDKAMKRGNADLFSGSAAFRSLSPKNRRPSRTGLRRPCSVARTKPTLRRSNRRVDQALTSRGGAADRRNDWQIGIMAKLLEKALEKVSSLPQDEQDAIASQILAELEDEAAWETRFASQEGKLRVPSASTREVG